ncbi:hypothetical protein ACFVTC_11260 [Streptomyces sp. NPDC057950]|uniref:hypothetical protein n=1 Tax=Streptomyces sp. NPDC057950 TaxID=3346288 RepID=UPI0036F11B58
MNPVAHEAAIRALRRDMPGLLRGHRFRTEQDRRRAGEDRYVSVRKGCFGKRPRTWVAPTPTGRKSLAATWPP